jgi:hypothetical protein
VFWWRAARDRSWRAALPFGLNYGLLGAVAKAAGLRP